MLRKAGIWWHCFAYLIFEFWTPTRLPDHRLALVPLQRITLEKTIQSFSFFLSPTGSCRGVRSRTGRHQVAVFRSTGLGQFHITQFRFAPSSLGRPKSLDGHSLDGRRPIVENHISCTQFRHHSRSNGSKMPKLCRGPRLASMRLSDVAVIICRELLCPSLGGRKWMRTLL